MLLTSTTSLKGHKSQVDKLGVIGSSEPLWELYNHLSELYKKWEMKKKLWKSSFWSCFKVRVWAQGNEPESAQKADQLVETFLGARLGPKTYRYEVQH